MDDSKGHCWHYVMPGCHSLGWPPRHAEQCCWCGGIRSQLPVQPEGHGKHAPSTLVGAPWSYDERVFPGSCPARPAMDGKALAGDPRKEGR